MIGLGLDAVEVDRFRRVLARTPGIADRVFTAGERAYGFEARDPAPRLAARFAAKEAAMKALGVGIGAVGWHDVEVVRADGGAPALRVTGRAAALAAAQGVRTWRVSLTHTDAAAEAIVIAL
ncbi:MAG: holo-[acyl-carrier protein] synthase [Actinomycetota bacterium]|nr:holo-[acyl-carrier protein] synthase [Actinomycetota bacterium]